MCQLTSIKVIDNVHRNDIKKTSELEAAAQEAAEGAEKPASIEEWKAKAAAAWESYTMVPVVAKLEGEEHADWRLNNRTFDCVCCSLNAEPLPPVTVALFLMASCHNYHSSVDDAKTPMQMNPDCVLVHEDMNLMTEIDESALLRVATDADKALQAHYFENYHRMMEREYIVRALKDPFVLEQYEAYQKWRAEHFGDTFAMEKVEPRAALDYVPSDFTMYHRD